MCTLKFNVHLHEDVEELRIRHRRIIDSSMLNDDQQQHEMFAVIANVHHHFWFAVFRLSNRCDIRRLVLTVLSKLRCTPILRRGIGSLRISNVGMGILRKRCLRVRKQCNGRLSLRQMSSCYLDVSISIRDLHQKKFVQFFFQFSNRQ